MKLKTIFITTLIGLAQFTNAQVLKNYFSIEPVYNFNISKTNLDREKIPSTGFGLFLINKEAPKKLFFGKSFGLKFYIPVKERFQIGTGLTYEIKGQSSKKWQSTSNIEDKFMYSFILESYQIPIDTRFFLGKKIKYFNQFILGEFITDIYSKFTVQEYKINSEHGKQAASYETFYYVKKSHKENFKRHWKESLIRFGMGVGYGISFDELKFFTIKSNISFRFYSNLLNQDISYAVKGNAILINLGFIIGLKLTN